MCSARIRLDARGIYIFDHEDRQDGRKTFSITEIYASLTAGQTLLLEGPSYVRWKYRHLAEIGLLDPVPQEFPELPPGLSPNAQRLAVGIRLLFSLRRMAETPETGVPLAKTFLSTWYGRSESAAQAAKSELKAVGFIVLASDQPRNPREARLWLPGKGSASDAGAQNEEHFRPEDLF